MGTWPAIAIKHRIGATGSKEILGPAPEVEAAPELAGRLDEIEARRALAVLLVQDPDASLALSTG